MLLVSCCYSFLVNGMLVLATGAVMPYLLKDFKLDYAQGGFLLLIQAAGNLISGVASGIISVYIGRKWTLLMGAAAFFAGFGGITLTSSASLLTVFIFISGLGWGTVNNLVNAVLTDKTKGKGSIINILHTSFAVGAFSAPALTGLAVASGVGWRSVTALVSGLSLILMVVFLFLRIEPAGTLRKREKLSLDFLREFRYYIFMGVLFFYVGSEVSIGGWLVTYLIDADITGEAAAQSMLSLLWIAVIFGRLLCAWITGIFPKKKVILACSICTIAFYGLFLLLKTPAVLYPCIFFLGISLAGIYPTTVADASYLTRGSGIASGILFSFGGIGASVMPYLTGVFAQYGGIRSGMLVILFSCTLLAFFALLNGIGHKEKIAE